MNTGGDAAEQIVRMSLNGLEVAAKISGAGAKNIAILLYTILKDQKKTKGKARLTSMIRSGKELDVFSIKKKDLKIFCQEAKKYGILYCTLGSQKAKDGMVDVIVRAEDAPRINRIIKRFALTTVDKASVVKQDGKVKDHDSTMPEPEITTPNKEEKDKLLDALMGKPTQKEEATSENPSVAKTEKSPPSAPILEKPSKSAVGATTIDGKPSVRAELQRIKKSRQEPEITPKEKEQSTDRKAPKVPATTHKQPPPRKKPKKQREAR
jgi:hypothetical protein